VVTDFQAQGKRWAGIWAVMLITMSLGACDSGSKESRVITPGPQLPKAGGTLPSLATSIKNFDDLHFAGSGVCGDCHSNDQSIPVENRVMVVDAEGGGKKDVSLGVAWETSTMANSARDPYWHAVVANELNLYPNLSNEINDKCTICHAPMANVLSKKENNGINYQIFSANGNTGLLDMDDSSSLFNHAMDGVSCALCHQIEDVGLGTPQSMTGGYTIPTATEATKDARPAYGQYANPDAIYMMTVGNFTPKYSAHISTSEVCATCHNLNIKPVDKLGAPVAGITHFAEQAMYTEWQESDFAVGKPQQASCQSCHMPKLDSNVFLATSNASNARPDFAEHTFLAANTVIQQIMHDNKTALGIDESIDFLPSIERNRQFLQTSANVSVQVNGFNAAEQVIDFDVAVENLTGHKLPSGYHSRRAYLHVLITDANGVVVYENGSIDEDGAITGVDEDINVNFWESHHNVITQATQVQVYQAIPGNNENERTHSLLNSAKYLKDNRLTPIGFDKNNVPDDVAVVPFNISVEFRYQPIAKGHLDDLFSKSNEVPSIDHFRTMYDRTPFKDEVMATASAVAQ